MGCCVLALGAIVFRSARMSALNPTSIADKPEWSVSSGYTPQNRVVPGVMIASIKSVGDRDGELSVRCSKIAWGVYVDTRLPPALEPGTDNFTVAYAFDRGESTSVVARPTGTVLYIGGAALVRQLLHTSRFSFRFSTYEDKPASLDFDARGLASAVTTLRAACPARGI